MTLPGAVNLPLMVDEERHQVGIAYKQQGQHPDAIIYCFRGGLRSQIAQQWLVDAGLHRPRIEGGWKAQRQRLCQRIDEAAAAGGGG